MRFWALNQYDLGPWIFRDSLGCRLPGEGHGNFYVTLGLRLELRVKLNCMWGNGSSSNPSGSKDPNTGLRAQTLKC